MFKTQLSEICQGTVVSLNLAKKPTQGEDADPVAINNSDGLWIGVFDGMGGSGATLYVTDDGPRTGAYIASRLAANTFRTWVEQNLSGQESLQRGSFIRRASSLQAEMVAAFSSAYAKLGDPNPRIRSRLLKALPTTAAILGVRDRGDGVFECNALWAGDSRCFFITPMHGLVQMSKDHLKEDLDPQQNLSGDSPLSNYIAANQSFYIEEVWIPVQGPLLAIVASDGCFGYVESPAMFEHIILAAISESTSVDELSAHLAASISAIAGDDASIVIAQFGWSSFGNIRESLSPRTKVVEEYSLALKGASDKIAKAQHAVRLAQQSYSTLREEIWHKYKHDYQPEFKIDRAES